ncbi:hypothetical protein CCY99_09015 [Helicobacter sp. 16-1353]|uniref:hypothetical protein n=1 Tax=Helicobacter sp. 16-1353 TaxID=2004996 RepID=UPI000DCC86D2|nr:hypothetical protein [Helicobacter sp. 16-1353]RAX51502.1 hypothetical protein CCY99_09015 [Helicobacter sp. 16-1353]
MLILGHIAIDYPNFIHIKSIDDLAKTLPKDIVWFNASNDVDYNIAKHCRDNNIAYSVVINELKDAIIFANLGAKYIIISDKHLAEITQKVANEYFFDSKILYIVNDESSIENMAMLGIDGVIFNNILKTN